ncbi:class I SAM-dependent methyltransferase [Rhizobacter sp. Root1221]|uniref:class I SAM-dependent methyltransferase n=1 Tax=Rhizobacter sp. Root1221 TaxID=1736433 RepID=UPI0006F83C7C|nr:class I SAM-dependent methyltransferase [Rhizobacter sp. Root1221]KQV99214.1 hypothetical protein ASC87_20690 [Rhizobacter sp. Root1221]
MTSPQPDKYIIKGGEQGRSRLAVIARVLAPTTSSLLDRFEPLRGMVAVDAGCGGGDVALELARRVGPGGRVIGLDRDEPKLALAREEASRSGIANVEFTNADMLGAWPVNDADLANLRFVLTHVANPGELLRRAHDALQPGGIVVVEDIDYGGQFCDPPSAAVDQYCEVYVRTARQHGGNPFVGRSLARLLESVGFSEVDSCLVQPYGRTGDIKQVAPLTLAAIGETVRSSGTLSGEELDQLTHELQVFMDREDTTISFPRIFQAWGRKR